MYGIKAIVSKELRRVFKDKKMIMSLFVLPVILVVGLFSLIGLLVKGQMDDVESHAPVVYIIKYDLSILICLNHSRKFKGFFFSIYHLIPATVDRADICHFSI